MPGPDRSPLVLGTAGHIDHGKTALVEALTGVNTDRLPEEQARGISIELGFARLDLPSGRSLGVVDVPGHERFVRTMVAGATGIDVFLLVVAADDGVMPQTREHMTVIETLSVPAGVVAVTKADLVDTEGLELAREETAELLGSGPYEGCPVVPVSVRTGAGVKDLARALDRIASGVDDRAARSAGHARLHVDRRFSMKGIGTVVTGTLWSGSLRDGEEVRIEPTGLAARVRGIESHGGRRERVEAGERVALNLAGRDSGAVERGDVVMSAGAGLRASYRVDVVVELRPGVDPLRRGARVHLHHGTRECPARVTPLEGDALEPGRRAYAQLRLERPVVAAHGDRFVLRAVAPPDTIGGGLVLDPAPERHGPGSPHVERLASLESGDPLDRLAQELANAPSGLGEAEADGDLLESLCAAGTARRVGRRRPRYFAPAQLDRARAGMLAALEGAARLTSTGALADAAGLSDSAAAAVLEALVEEGRVLARGPGFAATKAEPEHPAARLLLDALRSDFLEPRSVDALGAALADDGERVRALLEDMALEGRLVRVKPGIFYHPDALEDVRRRIVSICGREGSITIARLRDELGTSRKYAQALLEHFDRDRLTRRDGDVHVVRRGAEGGRV